MEDFEPLIKVIHAGGVNAVQAAQARLAVEVAQGVSADLKQLGVDVNHAQAVLGTRLTELTGELGTLRKSMADSANASSDQTAALVRLTRWYVWLTGGIVVASIIAALAALLSIFWGKGGS